MAPNAMIRMRFAHLTDFHLPPPSSPRFRNLLGKRALGYLSWRRKRRFRHALWALETVIEDCRRQSSDFEVITGDVVNIGLEAEFTAARKWLTDRFNFQKTAIAPGNHDAYVPLAWKHGIGQFSSFMHGVRYDDPDPRPPRDAADFPYVRVVGEACFIVLNSARATAPGLATGRLGPAQIVRLKRELARAADRRLCRIVALHHPAVAGVVSRRKALDDDAALRAALAEENVELVIHGHAHRPAWSQIQTSAGLRPVVGGGSASHACAYDDFAPARYNMFTVSQSADGAWRIDVVVRELDSADRSVRSVEQRRLL